MLAGSRVLVVGVGGLGCPAALALATSGAPDEVVDRSELSHRLAQPGGVELGELPGITPGKCLCALERGGKAALHTVGPVTFDERFEIPGGRLKLGIGRLWGGGCHRLAA